MLFCSKVKVIVENTEFVTYSPVNKNSYKNGKKQVLEEALREFEN